MYVQDVSKEFFTSKRAYIKHSKALTVSIDNKMKAGEVKAEEFARETVIASLADATEEAKEKLCGKEKADPIWAQDSAPETKIVLLADAMENDKKKI